MLLKWTRSYGRFLDLLPHLLLMVPALISFCSFPLHYSRKISASSMSLFTQFKLANATFSALHIGLLFLLFYLSCKKCKCWNFAHFYPSSYHRVWAVGQTLGKMANKGGTAWSVWERGWWYLKWRQRAGSDISSCLVKEEEEEGSCVCSTFFPLCHAADGWNSISAAVGTWVFFKFHQGEQNLLLLLFPLQQSKWS